MEIAEILSEVRKLPDDQLLEFAAQVDDEAARVVDLKFEKTILNSSFDKLAEEALTEYDAGKTVLLDEIVD